MFKFNICTENIRWSDFSTRCADTETSVKTKAETSITLTETEGIKGIFRVTGKSRAFGEVTLISNVSLSDA